MGKKFSLSKVAAKGATLVEGATLQYRMIGGWRKRKGERRNTKKKDEKRKARKRAGAPSLTGQSGGKRGVPR